jgi:predicted DNA binding CopG/RHH family protein
MKKNINSYTGAPLEIAKEMEESVSIPNFLPAPEELIRKESTKKITLAVDSQSLAIFKVFAKKHGGKYQSMMRKILDSYARNYIAKHV